MKTGKNIFLVMLLLFFAGTSLLFAQERRFSEIKFNGLKNITKYEIVNEAGIRVTSEEILANTDIIKKVLSDNPLVASFFIESSGSQLIITVEERIISACVAVTVQNATVPILVSDDFTVLSVTKTADIAGPLFVVESGEIVGNEMSGRFRDVYRLIKQAGSAYPLLYGEIEEVTLVDGGQIEISFKSRPARCRMQPVFRNLKRLNYVLGYMDASGIYTDFFEIDGDSVVIR